MSLWKMNLWKQLKILMVALAMLLVMSGGALAQDRKSVASDKSDSNTTQLTIMVTGGDEKKPVDSASVYVRFDTSRKLAKDKHIEMNLKTNLSGVCHAQAIPHGKFLVQVVAPGWKTFGEYYQAEQSEQTINISLARPPKWY